jgi:hypothetical protein
MPGFGISFYIHIHTFIARGQTRVDECVTTTNVISISLPPVMSPELEGYDISEDERHRS